MEQGEPCLAVRFAGSWFSSKLKSALEKEETSHLYANAVPLETPQC